jgi:putative DNA primase/helicase
MTAADIAHALGDARREGRGWRCPLHNCRSLILRDGDGGCVLVTCWGGCDRRDVLAELRRRGLFDGLTTDYWRLAARTSKREDVARTARAPAIWHDARPAAGTIVESYLRSRGILLDAWPAALRFHPACPRPRDEAGNFRPPLPAMVAMVEHVQRRPVAVHASYLRPDGGAKADIPDGQHKVSFGPIKGGAVRLGFPPPIYICDRRYRALAALEAWDRSNARKAATQIKPRGTGGRFNALNQPPG